MVTIPVFMYHHVCPKKDDTVTVTPEVFEKQMMYIRKRGIRTLSLDELLDFMTCRKSVEEKACVITFDDGYLDNFLYAFPVLKRYRIKASIFIVTSWVDGSTEHRANRKDRIDMYLETMPTHRQCVEFIKKGLHHRAIMDWDMIQDMKDTGLVDFYSHTLSHRRCDGLEKEELLRELVESKERIEKRLGKECGYLCWPWGRYSELSLEVAREAGYVGMVTTARGVVRKGDSPTAINRIVVKDRPLWFRTRLFIYTDPFLSHLYLGLRRS